MGLKQLQAPIKKRVKKKGKITVYPAMEVAELYVLGSENGWDTVAIAKQGVTDAILAMKEDLIRKAPVED